jgi:hypothetical protein
MSPIKAGDTAIVIGGLGRDKSPNIGLEVLVKELRGEHSRFGRVWRCYGAGVKQLTDGGEYQTLGWADFPASWLQKIDPLSTKMDATKEVEALK